MLTGAETDRVYELTEAVADGAFIRLEKELEAAVARDEFVTWAAERFKTSKTVDSFEALLGLYELP